MPDIEEVIKGLECCKSILSNACDVCPYNYNGEHGESSCLRGRLMPDAITLLKKQRVETDVLEYQEKVLDAFRNCITEPKCKDCPWESCEEFGNKKVYIPVDLALAVDRILAEIVKKSDTRSDSY